MFPLTFCRRRKQEKLLFSALALPFSCLLYYIEFLIPVLFFSRFIPVALFFLFLFLFPFISCWVLFFCLSSIFLYSPSLSFWFFGFFILLHFFPSPLPHSTSLFSIPSCIFHGLYSLLFLLCDSLLVSFSVFNPSLSLFSFLPLDCLYLFCFLFLPLLLSSLLLFPFYRLYFFDVYSSSLFFLFFKLTVSFITSSFCFLSLILSPSSQPSFPLSFHCLLS